MIHHRRRRRQPIVITITGLVMMSLLSLFHQSTKIGESGSAPPILALSNNNNNNHSWVVEDGRSQNVPVSGGVNKTIAPKYNYAARKVSYLTMYDIRHTTDAYAAAWWMSVRRFRAYKTNAINNEGVVFRAMAPGNSIRMTVDWTEFSVEHLSKWWKVFDYSRYTAGHERLVRNLYRYVYQSLQSEALLDSDDPSNPMTDTLAVLPYAPMTTGMRSERDRLVDVVVLAAQVVSLIKIGCGRVALVLHSPHLPYVVKRVWPALLELLQVTSTKTTFLSWIEWWSDYIRRNNQEVEIDTSDGIAWSATKEGTEIVLVPINTSDPRTIPIATVQFLHEALFHGDSTFAQATSWSDEEYTMLLGPRSIGWKYIYYTEPDSPVLTRPYALPQFRTILDQGKTLFPHRLTVVAHESDVAKPRDDVGSSRENRLSSYDLPPNLYLPAKDNWTNVVELSFSVGCCDSGKHYYPALDNFPGVKGLWYTEGFGQAILPNRTNEHRERFRRMTAYSLMRFPYGSNITLFQGTAQGRVCTVQLGGCAGSLN